MNNQFNLWLELADEYYHQHYPKAMLPRSKVWEEMYDEGFAAKEAVEYFIKVFMNEVEDV